MVLQVDMEKAERWLDELKPEKDELPEHVNMEHYYGALAMLESMGMDWVQLDNGQHLILGTKDAHV